MSEGSEKSCKAFAELVSAYLDSHLTEEQSASVEAHLGSCPECARRLEDYRRIRELLHTEKVKCPVDLAGTVMGNLEREHLLTGLDELDRPPASRRIKLLRLTAAAAMIGILAYIAVLAVQLTGTNKRSPLAVDLPATSYHGLASREESRWPGSKGPVPVAEPATPRLSGEPAGPMVARVREKKDQWAMAKSSKSLSSQKPSPALVHQPAESEEPDDALAFSRENRMEKTDLGVFSATCNPAGFPRSLDRQVPMVYRMSVSDLPTWMFLKEQTLQVLTSNRLEPVKEPEGVAPALGSAREFYYQAKKGLDLAPGVRSSQILVQVRPETLNRIYIQLQQVAVDNVTHKIHPELDNLLRGKPVNPALAGLADRTQRNLAQYFSPDNYRSSVSNAAFVTTSVAALKPMAASQSTTATSRPTESVPPVVPMLIDIRLAPQPTTTASAPTTRP